MTRLLYAISFAIVLLVLNSRSSVAQTTSSTSTTASQTKTGGSGQATVTSSTVAPKESAESNINNSELSKISSSSTAASENAANSTLPLDHATSLSPESSTETSTPETATPETMPESDSVPLNYDLFCTCDLIAGQCDVHCCCDPDCDQDARRLFNHCWMPPVSHFDRYYCSPDLNRYGVVWNNTQEFRTEWDRHSGLFCIVTDNVPKRRLYEDKPPATEDELFQEILPKVSTRWNDRHALPPGLEQWVHYPFYKEGSPLFTLHPSGAINVLKLPRSLNSASCNIAKWIGFLQSESYSCELPGDRCDPDIRPEEWLANLAVFRLPAYAAYSSRNSNSSIHWGDLDKLAPVVLRTCLENSECRSDIAPPPASCQNTLTAVKMLVTINGTEGILSVLVDLYYATRAVGAVLFETTYHSSVHRPGADNNQVRIRSGNPGYLGGKPIVAAKLNTSSGEGAYQLLHLFPGTPKSRLIRFGEDSFQTIRMNGIRMDNRTQWCSKWRHFVLESFWGPNVDEMRLAAFGNTELNDTAPGMWLPIEIRSELICFGSVIHAELVIMYTKSGSYDQPQHKLLGAGLQLRTTTHTSYCVESATCSLLLSQTVAFVSTESPTFMVLPQPPRWKIQLPRDFFYPFLLSSAGAGIHIAHTYVLLCFTMISFALTSA